MRLWGEDKRLERRRRAICYIPKSHLLPESSCFSDICPRWLAKQSRAVDQLMQSSLRKSIGISLWLQSSLKIALGYLSSAIPSEGKPLRPDGGALESEEMGPFIMKLLLFSHLWHFYTWNPRLCDYLKSNHICLAEIIKSLIAVDLIRTGMGMALKDFSFWGLAFWNPPGGLMLSVHLSA